MNYFNFFIFLFLNYLFFSNLNFMESIPKINIENNINNNTLIDYTLNDSFDKIIDKWINNLKKRKSKYVVEQNNSDLIINKKFNDAPFHVLDNDINRTKTNEMKKYNNFKSELKQLLKFYCEINSIQYKQGMNEIMTVFLSMKLKEPSIEFYKVYNCFSYFMDFFLINFYRNKEISALNSCCALLDLLLKYHEPEIYNIFNTSFIIPQIYSTNWILTCCTNKNPIVVSYVIFNFLISEMDNSLIFFLCIGLFKYYKETILNLQPFKIIDFISKLNIENINIANSIINLALEIRENTPYSLYILMKRLLIYFPYSNYIQRQFDLYQPQYIKIFPIFPNEVLFRIFPSGLSCPDLTCRNFNNFFFKENKIPKKGLCEYCQFYKKKINNKYIILDLRILNNEKYNCIGVLPNMLILDKTKLNNEKEKIENYIYKELIKIKNKNNYPVHIILLTNFTDNYENFEKDLYKTNHSSEELINIKYGLGWNKEKELNHNALNTFLNNNENKKSLIKEYNNFRNIINKLIKEGFKYVSYIYGGYKDIHYLSQILNISIPLHKVERCYFCNENNEEKKKYITEKEFNLICGNLENTIFPCMYGKNKNGTIIFTKNTLIVFCSKISSDKRIFFEIAHYLKETNILSFSAPQVNDLVNTSLTFLYTKNKSLSNLVLVTLNLLNEIALSKFLKMCYKYNICNMS